MPVCPWEICNTTIIWEAGRSWCGLQDSSRTADEMTVQISDWQGSTAARVLNPHSAWEEVCEVGCDGEEGEEGEGEEERGPVLSQPERVLSLVSRDWAAALTGLTHCGHHTALTRKHQTRQKHQLVLANIYVTRLWKHPDSQSKRD